MASHPPSKKKRNREYRNIFVTQIIQYRLPFGAMVSIMHRVSGAMLFVMLPLAIWLFDHSLTSEVSYERFTALFDGLLGIPGWLVKLVVLSMIWGFLHHLCAGLRHLVMDIFHGTVAKKFGTFSALAVLVVSITLTLALGAKLFGLY